MSGHSASGKLRWSLAFLSPAGRTLLGKALYATFTKPVPPWCYPHKYILGVCCTLETILRTGADELARYKEGEAPFLAFRLGPGSAARCPLLLKPHLARVHNSTLSSQSCHQISANLRRRKFRLRLPPYLLSVFAAGRLSPAVPEARPVVGTARHCGAARGRAV